MKEVFLSCIYCFHFSLVLNELQKEGIETESFSLAGKSIRGCRACFKCFEKKDEEGINIMKTLGRNMAW